MYTYACVYIYIYIHIYTSTYIYIYIYTYTLSKWILVREMLVIMVLGAQAMRVFVESVRYIQTISTHVIDNVLVYLCIYLLYIYIYMYIYIYREREREI